MMHPSLSYHVTPPDQRPFVATRTRSVGVRFELGQIAPEPVPPVVYQPMPAGEFFDPAAVVVARPTPWRPVHEKAPTHCRDCVRGPGCGQFFLPRHPASVRCPKCREKRWHGTNTVAAQQRATTAAIDRATRARAVRGEHRRQSAAARRGQLGRRSAA